MIKDQDQFCQQGFTLIEMLVVIAIIAIIALLAVPSQLGKHNQIKVLETIELAENFKQNIQAYYQLNGKFPEDNSQASMPEAEKIIGNYLKRLEVEDGAMHLVFGKKLSSLDDQILTVFPVYVKDSPLSPISWVCGYGQAPEGMEVAGENKTSIAKSNLPIRCR